MLAAIGKILDKTSTIGIRIFDTNNKLTKDIKLADTKNIKMEVIK